MKGNFKRSQEIFQGISVPSRPAIMLEMLKVQRGCAPSVPKMFEIVKRDPALAGAVLQAANTTLPGEKRTVVSIQKALSLLSFQTLREITSTLFLNVALTSKDGPLQAWRFRAEKTAKSLTHLAQVLPERAAAYQSGYLPRIHPEEAYTVGLLHDVGVVLFLQRYPDYQDLYETAIHSDNMALIEEEERRYGVHHGVAGSFLGEQWQLPKFVCQVILEHHHSEALVTAGKKVKQLKEITLHALLKMTDWLTGTLSPFEQHQYCVPLFRHFGISNKDLDFLKNEMERSL